MLPVHFFPLMLLGSFISQPKPRGQKRQRVLVETRPTPNAAAVRPPSSSSVALEGPTRATSLTFANPVQVLEPGANAGENEVNEYEGIELECQFDDACRFSTTNFFPSTTFPRPDLTKLFNIFRICHMEVSGGCYLLQFEV